MYAHIFPNGKRYVGITSQRLNERFRKNGEGYKGQFVYNAIKKYGWHNIEHRILYTDLSKREAEKLEISIIKEWKTTNRKYGYNRATGGMVNVPTEESKIKNSLAHKGKNIGKDNPFFGKHHSIEVKRNLGRSVYCYELNKVFYTLQEAENATGCSKQNIYKVCKGIRKTAGGMRWRYETR